MACKWCEQGECWTHGQIEKPEGFGKGKGKAKGKDKGFAAKGGKAWAPVLRPQFQAPLFQAAPAWGKGGGKSFGKDFGKGKGKDKGKDKGKSKLKGIDDSLKVWVGGFSAEPQKPEMEEHFNQAGTTTWIQVMGKNKDTACVCYSTIEEVENAILSMNGSLFGNDVLEVDVWTKKPKVEGA